jgi:hypothetical protein
VIDHAVAYVDGQIHANGLVGCPSDPVTV